MTHKIERLLLEKHLGNDIRETNCATLKYRHHFHALGGSEVSAVANFLLEKFHEAGISPEGAYETQHDPQSGTTLAFEFPSRAYAILEKLRANLESTYGADAEAIWESNPTPKASGIKGLIRTIGGLWLRKQKPSGEQPR